MKSTSYDEWKKAQYHSIAASAAVPELNAEKQETTAADAAARRREKWGYLFGSLFAIGIILVGALTITVMVTYAFMPDVLQTAMKSIRARYTHKPAVVTLPVYQKPIKARPKPLPRETSAPQNESESR